MTEIVQSYISLVQASTIFIVHLSDITVSYLVKSNYRICVALHRNSLISRYHETHELVAVALMQ